MMVVILVGVRNTVHGDQRDDGAGDGYAVDRGGCGLRGCWCRARGERGVAEVCGFGEDGGAKVVEFALHLVFAMDGAFAVAADQDEARIYVAVEVCGWAC